MNSIPRNVTRLLILQLAVVCALVACACPLAAQHFYFAQMTDIHFGQDDNAERAAKVVDSINRVPFKIECVVATGDITNAGMLDEAAVKAGVSTMKKLGPPVHYVAGNHDIREGDKAAAMEEAFVKNFGPLASKAEYGGVVFLMVYTETLKSKVQIAGYDPIAWLDQALKDAGSKPVIVFTHSPAVEDYWGEKPFPGWPRESREKWDPLIKSPNVKAVITGHFHRDELYWIGGTPEYVCPPVSGSFGRQTTYRIYEYTDGKLGYRTVYL